MVLVCHIMSIEFPSSKWWVSAIVSTIIGAVAIIDAAQGQDVDLPAWVYLIGAILSPIAVYLKAENRPSSSAIEAAELQAAG